MLRGLKLRNGFGEKDLTAAVGKALRRRAARRKCEDCGAKVASGAAHSGVPHGRGRSGPLGLAIPKPRRRLAPSFHIEFPASHLRN